MRTILSYPTKIGEFYIGQSSVNKKYHILFNEESLGEYSSVQEAVNSLVEGKSSQIIDPDSGKEVEVETLGIAKNYTEWDTSYS